jgi:hypothetical protein
MWCDTSSLDRWFLGSSKYWSWKVRYPFETTETTYPLKLWHVSEDRNPLLHCCENPKYCMLNFSKKYWHSSSSYCRTSVANAPDVLQPYWLIVLLLDVSALTTSLLCEILAARCVIMHRPKDVPTLSTSSALPRALSRERWSCRLVNLDFYQLSPLVVFKRF